MKTDLQTPLIIIGFWAVFEPEGSRIGVLGGRGPPQALHSSVRLYMNLFFLVRTKKHYRTKKNTLPLSDFSELSQPPELIAIWPECFFGPVQEKHLPVQKNTCPRSGLEALLSQGLDQFTKDFK